MIRQAEIGMIVGLGFAEEQLMNTSTPLVSVRHIAWVLWFPILFALALPFVWEITFHAPQAPRSPKNTHHWARKLDP